MGQRGIVSETNKPWGWGGGSENVKTGVGQRGVVSETNKQALGWVVGVGGGCENVKGGAGGVALSLKQSCGCRGFVKM